MIRSKKYFFSSYFLNTVKQKQHQIWRLQSDKSQVSCSELLLTQENVFDTELNFKVVWRNEKESWSSGFSWKKELGVSTQAISTGVLVTPLFEISIQRKWTKKKQFKLFYLWIRAMQRKTLRMKRETNKNKRYDFRNIK